MRLPQDLVDNSILKGALEPASSGDGTAPPQKSHRLHSSIVPFTLQSLTSRETLPWVSFYRNQKKQQQQNLIQLYNQNECFCQSLFGSSFFLSFVISGWGSCRVAQTDPEFMILLPTKVLGLLWSTTFSKFSENKPNQDLYYSFRLRVNSITSETLEGLHAYLNCLRFQN